MLTTKQDDLMPKKKFAFTMRKKESDTSVDLPREDKHNELFAPLSISNASMQCGFSNKEDEKISMQVYIPYTL